MSFPIPAHSSKDMKVGTKVYASHFSLLDGIWHAIAEHVENSYSVGERPHARSKGAEEGYQKAIEAIKKRHKVNLPTKRYQWNASVMQFKFQARDKLLQTKYQKKQLHDHDRQSLEALLNSDKLVQLMKTNLEGFRDGKLEIFEILLDTDTKEGCDRWLIGCESSTQYLFAEIKFEKNAMFISNMHLCDDPRKEDPESISRHFFSLNLCDVLTVQDNGHGILREKLEKVLSFSEGQDDDIVETEISHFGDGFKDAAVYIGPLTFIMSKGIDEEKQQFQRGLAVFGPVHLSDKIPRVSTLEVTDQMIKNFQEQQNGKMFFQTLIDIWEKETGTGHPDQLDATLQQFKTFEIGQNDENYETVPDKWQKNVRFGEDLLSSFEDIENFVDTRRDPNITRTGTVFYHLVWRSRFQAHKFLGDSVNPTKIYRNDSTIEFPIIGTEFAVSLDGKYRFDHKIDERPNHVDKISLGLTDNLSDNISREIYVKEPGKEAIEVLYL